MSVQSVLKDQLHRIHPDPTVIKELTKLSKAFNKHLKEDLANAGYDAQIFIGGSFAKGTIVKKPIYDVDIFVRFSWKYDAISDILESVLKNTVKRAGLRLERIHGSRDYFKCYPAGNNYYLEIIPVTKIAKPHQERNVTDLSYFHVAYVKKKIKGLEDEIRLAKAFCQAQRVYGAESYIRGFSGHALDCLIIHYKSFVKMLRELVKVKPDNRLVIDTEKYYKKKQEVFFEMNENRLHSPVILVDPTYKERNALAALSHETFATFQAAAKAFLKQPDASFFEHQEIEPGKLAKEAKKKRQEFVHVRLQTNRQPGDIAGTKLRKFSETIVEEFKRYYTVSRVEFEYHGAQTADLYVTGKSKKKIVQIGPPIDGSKYMKKHAKKFKEEHPTAYEKNKFLHADILVDFTAKEFFSHWSVENQKKMLEMGIVDIHVA